jgi:hypothetical protein
MLSKNLCLQLEMKLDRWGLVALEKFLTSEANWFEVPDDVIKEVGDGTDQEQELRLAAQPFAKITHRSAWRKDGYWDEATVTVEFVTGIQLIIPGRTLPVPAKFAQGLFKALELFPEQMQVVQSVV